MKSIKGKLVVPVIATDNLAFVAVTVLHQFVAMPWKALIPEAIGKTFQPYGGFSGDLLKYNFHSGSLRQLGADIPLLA